MKKHAAGNSVVFSSVKVILYHAILEEIMTLLIITWFLLKNKIKLITCKLGLEKPQSCGRLIQEALPHDTEGDSTMLGIDDVLMHVC